MTNWRQRFDSSLPFVAGAMLLLMAMGIGRFAYTPLLPVMQIDDGLTLQLAGLLASANLAGYLIGALLSTLRAAHAHRTWFIAAAAATIVITTAAMSLPPPAWISARFFTGVGSGVVFVLTVSLMLEIAMETESRAGMAILFCGVGAGIMTAGCLSPVFVASGGSRFAWLAFSVIAAVTSIGPIWVISRRKSSAGPALVAAETGRTAAGFGWLLLFYGIEGAAYIIPATFLSAMAATTPGVGILKTIAWPIVGFVALPSALLWNFCARRLGQVTTLVAIAFVQAAAMLAPLILPAASAIAIVSVALGGTFIGLTAVGTAFGRTFMPGRGNVAVGILTGIYGVGQIVGPLVATKILTDTGSYQYALLASSLPLLVATLFFGIAFRSQLAFLAVL